MMRQWRRARPECHGSVSRAEHASGGHFARPRVMAPSRSRAFLLLAIVFGLQPIGALSAQDDLALREQAAFNAAVAHVAPSVVSIDAIGGLEQAQGVLLGSGPTTGLIVSADGYIISSAFNFAQRPASILVGLPDGTRTPAELVATDRNRMLVLLKVTVDDPLPVPQMMPRGEVAVGMWSIAVGRTFDPAVPNMSVGIVSATNRVWGKAIQTDAKVSPANYGGPLVDLRGRVMGVLVPLSPDKSSEVAGVDWYDSGIGFAVPLEHVMQVLPLLAAGENLKPGILGVQLREHGTHIAPAVIAGTRPNSPAYKAGLKPGDEIVAIDEQPVRRQAELFEQIHQRYAGDTVELTVARGEEKITAAVELVDHLDPYRRPFFGMLPLRAAAEIEKAEGDADEEPRGVAVRWVYPGSPAEKAGIQRGDRIISVDGQQMIDLASLTQRLAAQEIGVPLELGVARGNEELNISLVATTEPAEALAAELPPPHGELAEVDEEELPPRGSFTKKVPGEAGEALVYVPENYHPHASYGLLVWLHPPGGFDGETLLQRWSPLCDEYHLILAAPSAAEPRQWRANDVAFIKELITDLQGNYAVDPQRVVVHGHEQGGAMATLLAYTQRDKVRGLAVVGVPLPGEPPENEPQSRLSVLVGYAEEHESGGAIAESLTPLRDAHYPVTTVELGKQPRYFNDQELGTLLRWIDTLDRL